jgi:O-antigen/teichoic acid export membrane protein
MTTPQRSRNAALNFATSLGFTVVTLLGAMVSSRLIVHWVGKGRFGNYRTLTEWFGYLALLELGLGGAVGPLLSRSLSAGDRPALRATLAAATRAYLAVMVAAIGVGLVLVALLPGIIPVAPAVRADLRLAGLISLIGFTTLPLVPLRSLADADQRGYQINLLLIGQFVVITATALVLCGIWPQWGIAGQAAAAAIGALILNFALFRATRLRLPGTPGEIARTRPDATVWRGIWGLSWPTLILQFSGRINLQTDSIVLSRVIDANAVAVLYFSSRLAQMAQQQLANVGTASWAGLADLHHRGEHETFRSRLLELFKLVTVLGIACVGPIVAYNRHFLALWVGPELDGGGLVALAAGANAVLVPLVSLAGWCISGTGRVRMLAGPSVISATLNLTSSVLLARYVGVAGPLLGTTLTMLCFGVWFNAWLLRRVFGLPLGGLARSVAVPLAWGLPYVASLWWLAASQHQLGWVGLGAQMATAAAGFLLLAMVVLLTPEERAAWKSRLGAFVERLRGFIPRRPAEAAASPPRAGK